MTTIVTRVGKGSPLTNTEMDTNLTNLNTYKLEVASNLSDLANAATARTNLGISATNTPNTPAGNIAATNVQTALNELDTEKLALAGGTMTGNLNVPSLNGGPLAGFRNKVINGGFNVWQRGAGPFTTAAKCADMWNISWDGTGGSRSVYQVTHAAGAELEGQYYYLRWVQTTAGTATRNSLESLIEYVRTFNGKTVTLSFQAKADAALTMAFFLRQTFGTGGSTEVDSGNTSFNLTTGWQKFTWTFTVPSVSGKTIVTDSKLTLIFLPPLTAFTIDITNVQLEEGSIATPFESRPLSIETLLCQRYFYALKGTAYLQGYATSATNANIPIYLPTPLRQGTGVQTTISHAYSDYTVNRADGSSWVTTTSIGAMIYQIGNLVVLSANGTGGPGSLVANQPVYLSWSGATPPRFLAVGNEL